MTLRRTTKTRRITLAIDIGGTGIKAMLLGPGGERMSDRVRVETPRPATPDAILGAVTRLVEPLGRFERVSVGFPGVVRRGVTCSAPNLDPTWQGFELAAEVQRRLRAPVRVANDADVQGMAVVSGTGVELVLTLGTGLGSALFVDGTLVPNLELAHHPCRRGRTYEDLLGAPALKRVGKKRWNKRVRRAIGLVERTFGVDRLYLGGGNAKQLSNELPAWATVVSNEAGLLGGLQLWRDVDRAS